MRLTKKVNWEGKTSIPIDGGKNYKNKTLELVVFDTDEASPKKSIKPNIDKYFGNLKWKGDPLEEQLRLRDEWE